MRGDRQGRDDGGQGVAADEFQHHSPGLAVRTRHSRAPNPWARASACLATSAGDCPETSRTATRSVYRVADTLPSTGRMTRPWCQGATPEMAITPAQRRR